MNLFSSERCLAPGSCHGGSREKDPFYWKEKKTKKLLWICICVFLCELVLHLKTFSACYVSMQAFYLYKYVHCCLTGSEARNVVLSHIVDRKSHKHHCCSPGNGKGGGVNCAASSKLHGSGVAVVGQQLLESKWFKTWPPQPESAYARCRSQHCSWIVYLCVWW